MRPAGTVRPDEVYSFSEARRPLSPYAFIPEEYYVALYWPASGRMHPGPVAESAPLAEAKLAPPRSRPGLVDRPRLLTSLSAAEPSALTLVAAPAGYGKTTAVEAWCTLQRLPVVWVTLDPGDNDAVRLWTYAATGVDRVHQGIGRSTLHRLRAPAVQIEASVDELLNQIAASGSRLVLVLEDLHLVTDQEALASIHYALEHLPSTLRLIIVTRSDPPFRVPEMRARGSLAELRAADLAFTTREAWDFVVGREGLDLGENEVEELRERTEGWPAALALAALWLRGVDDLHQAVKEFGGEHHFVAEYLTDAVIDNLDAEERAFILRASVLGRFTAELCDASLGRSDSTKMLRRLERTNLFIARLGSGEWFRIHSLFAEFATFRLASQEPGAAGEIHGRAASWLQRRGLTGEAARHAAAAGDYEFLATLLGDSALRLVRQGASRTLIQWTRELPDSYLVSHPEVALGAANATAVLGRRTVEMRRLLQLADRAPAGSRAGGDVDADTEAFAALARTGALDDDIGRQMAEAVRAVAFAEQGAGEYLVPALARLGRAQYLAGEIDDAWRSSLRAVEDPEAERRPMGHAGARATLSVIAAERGRITAARLHAERAQSIVAAIGNSRTWIGAGGSVALGVVLAAEGNLAEAERNLVLAEGLFEDEVATTHHTWALLLLARTRCRRGRLVEADTSLRIARAELAELTDGGRLPTLLAEIDLELASARRRAAGGELLEPPSDAELGVLRLLASDLSARQIGDQLFVSLNTVRSHTRALYRKLGVSSRAEAVARAAELGLLGRPESPA